ncbi:MAG: spore protease YyaC [Thermaerobacter sp.]|nr:spore protease YyaC [Thermaerobacter sp.]
MREQVIRPIRPRVRPADPHAAESLAALLGREIAAAGHAGCPATIICVGTDRSTGDALGPLVGTLLEQRHIPGLQVFGSLRAPVHAGNLTEFLPTLLEVASQGPVLAVDACLGNYESVGSVLVQQGPLRPGAGVRKELPPIGDVAVMATVNVGGFMEYVVLQNTRLSLVYDLAVLIADSVGLCFSSAARPRAGEPLPRQ